MNVPDLTRLSDWGRESLAALMSMKIALHLRQLAAAWDLTLILLPENRKKQLNKLFGEQCVVLTVSVSFVAIRWVVCPRLSDSGETS